MPIARENHDLKKIQLSTYGIYLAHYYIILYIIYLPFRSLNLIGQ